ASATATAAASAFAAIRNAIRSDCMRIEQGGDLSALALWSDDNPLAEDWLTTRRDWRAKGWSFWISWYEDALAGREPDWTLLEKVALIPDEIWEHGAEAVNARIAEIVDDQSGRADDQVGLDTMHPNVELSLERNARVICVQLEALRMFVEDEVQRVRGQNSLTCGDHDAISVRIEQLTKIIEAVTLMREALDEGPGRSGKALTVIEAQLPKVVDAADDAVALGGSLEASATVVNMAVSIKILVDAGTPGTLAAGYAFAEMGWGKITGYFKRR
ncbi:MAG: hypothetical protein WBA90_09275, partial [Albidovulum sp.]